jgi:ABC-2 type transport system permease protein
MILSSPMRLSTYFSMILIWTLIVSTINILIYIFIGTFIFGASIAISGSIIFVIIILILSIIAISGIGLISASTFLLYNIKGDIEPIAWIYATASGLLSGVLFPPSIFLDTYPILYTISRLLPQTYALEGIRRILNNPNLNPLNDSIVISDIVFLIIFSIILLPLGIIIFRHGLHKAEKDGKLARWAA